MELKEASATLVVAVGGGSSLDLGKVVAALATNPGSLVEYQWQGKPFTVEPLSSRLVPGTQGLGRSL